MKRIVFMMAVAVVVCGAARACDVCGCAASSQYIGLLPNYNRNFIGLQQQFSDFSGNYPSAYIGKPDDQVRDRYNTFQLWGRYGIGQHYQVFAFVPYQYNNRNIDGAKTTNSGIGDVSFLVNRIIINDEHKKWNQSLTAGAGMKLPTGKYTDISIADNRELPNIQPGTGSWDFMTNANYTLKHNRAGVNIDGSYTITTANKYSYKYGNRLNSGLACFYSFELKKLSIIPQAGVRYEYALNDYDNYSKKWLNEESGGYLLFATAGAQVYYKRFGGRLTYQLPVSQHYGGGDITAIKKMETSIFFLF